MNISDLEPFGPVNVVEDKKKHIAVGNLRGDYSRCDDQYVVLQDWEGYTSEQHQMWRLLYDRQARLLPSRTADVFLEGLNRLEISDGIPNLASVNETLDRAETGWRLVGVPGLLPAQTFFSHLAHRRLPIAVWIRSPEELDFLVEPDVFSDIFGHAPLLFNEDYAAALEQYGTSALSALERDELSQLARVFWYTFEFGLICTPFGLRAYGGGLVSSTELSDCLSRPVHRLRFELERVMRTLYRIDAYQDTYFAIDSFKQLFTFLKQYEIAPANHTNLLKSNTIPAETLLPDERDLPVEQNEVAISQHFLSSFEQEAALNKLPRWVQLQRVTDVIRLIVDIPLNPDMDRFVEFLMEDRPAPIEIRQTHPSLSEIEVESLMAIAVFQSGATRTIGDVKHISSGRVAVMPFDYWSLMDPDEDCIQNGYLHEELDMLIVGVE